MDRLQTIWCLARSQRYFAHESRRYTPDIELPGSAHLKSIDISMPSASPDKPRERDLESESSQLKRTLVTTTTKPGPENNLTLKQEGQGQGMAKIGGAEKEWIDRSTDRVLF